LTESNPLKSVLVASLVPEEEPWLQRFLDCLSKLDYPNEAIRYAFVEGKNVPLLHRWPKPDVWIKEVNPQISGRLERLAYLRNVIVDEALPVRGESYIFWIDCDVLHFPVSLIKDLKRHKVPVVAPGVWIEETSPEQFYDTFAFRDIYGQKVPAFNLRYKGFVEMGSVGTCYLADSRLYTELKIRYSGGDSEQVAFCAEARQKRKKVYADFDLKVLHANLPKYGHAFH
jgi:hypothetical protein